MTDEEIQPDAWLVNHEWIVNKNRSDRKIAMSHPLSSHNEYSEPEPLFSPKTLIGVDSEKLEKIGIDPEEFIREELPQWIEGILEAVVEERCRPDNCEITEEERSNAGMCEKHLEQRQKLKEVFSGE